VSALYYSEAKAEDMRWWLIVAFLAIMGAACSRSEAPNPTTEVQMASNDTTTTESGLEYKDLLVGEGEAARSGATAIVHYTGWLLDGTKFDSSVDRGTPFEFTLGAGQVIKGWDEGVGTMNVGGKRELIIPADLGYGDRGAGKVIPPGATLKFEVELLGLR
jgi:FKBP-type peptidyl-prolyl cis-trans isomerase